MYPEQEKRDTNSLLACVLPTSTSIGELLESCAIAANTPLTQAEDNDFSFIH